jgi:hypothetical protein
MDAIALWSTMLGGDGASLPSSLHTMLGWLGDTVQWRAPLYASGIEIFVLIPLLYCVVSQPNADELRRRFEPTSRAGWAVIALACVAVANLGQETVFIYFQF